MNSEHPRISIEAKTINGKPVFEIVVHEIINSKSAFGHKLLCDGLTFSLGSACVYKCAFCYVESMVRKHPEVHKLALELARRGLNFEDVVIIRYAALDIMREQLTILKPSHIDLQKHGVIFTSPLVDPAPTVPMAKQTAEACRIILELTNWDVRILSKSNLLPEVAKQIPEHFKHRMIFGVSTGTLDDRLAKSFEGKTPLVSKRLESLRFLQDTGHRTFGMICPSLPQVDYLGFAREMAAAIRVDRVEHVWAEALNVRGRSMRRTLAALQAGGYMAEAKQVESVCGPGKKQAWEQYTRDTFLAHTDCIPASKLRFLQYVTPDTRQWWSERREQGAVLLGKFAATTQPETLR
jgi:DNA repair photolyase